MAFVAANMNFPDPSRAKKVKKKTEAEVEELALQVEVDKVLRAKMNEAWERLRQREKELELKFFTRARELEQQYRKEAQTHMDRVNAQLKAAQFDAAERRKELRREIQKNDLLQRRVVATEKKMHGLAEQLEKASARLRQLNLLAKQSQDIGSQAPVSATQERRRVYLALEQLEAARRRIMELELKLEKATGLRYRRS